MSTHGPERGWGQYLGLDRKGRRVRNSLVGMKESPQTSTPLPLDGVDYAGNWNKHTLSPQEVSLVGGAKEGMQTDMPKPGPQIQQ